MDAEERKGSSGIFRRGDVGESSTGGYPGDDRIDDEWVTTGTRGTDRRKRDKDEDDGWIDEGGREWRHKESIGELSGDGDERNQTRNDGQWRGGEPNTVNDKRRRSEGRREIERWPTEKASKPTRGFRGESRKSYVMNSYSSNNSDAPFEEDSGQMSPVDEIDIHVPSGINLDCVDSAILSNPREYDEEDEDDESDRAPHEGRTKTSGSSADDEDDIKVYVRICVHQNKRANLRFSGYPYKNNPQSAQGHYTSLTTRSSIVDLHKIIDDIIRPYHRADTQKCGSGGLFVRSQRPHYQWQGEKFPFMFEKDGNVPVPIFTDEDYHLALTEKADIIPFMPAPGQHNYRGSLIVGYILDVLVTCEAETNQPKAANRSSNHPRRRSRPHSSNSVPSSTNGRMSSSSIWDDASQRTMTRQRKKERILPRNLVITAHLVGPTGNCGKHNCIRLSSYDSIASIRVESPHAGLHDDELGNSVEHDGQISIGLLRAKLLRLALEQKEYKGLIGEHSTLYIQKKKGTYGAVSVASTQFLCNEFIFPKLRPSSEEISLFFSFGRKKAGDKLVSKEYVKSIDDLDSTIIFSQDVLSGDFQLQSPAKVTSAPETNGGRRSAVNSGSQMAQQFVTKCILNQDIDLGWSMTKEIFKLSVKMLTTKVFQHHGRDVRAWEKWSLEGDDWPRITDLHLPNFQVAGIRERVGCKDLETGGYEPGDPENIPESLPSFTNMSSSSFNHGRKVPVAVEAANVMANAMIAFGDKLPTGSSVTPPRGASIVPDSSSRDKNDTNVFAFIRHDPNGQNYRYSVFWEVEGLTPNSSLLEVVLLAKAGNRRLFLSYGDSGKILLELKTENGDSIPFLHTQFKATKIITILRTPGLYHPMTFKIVDAPPTPLGGKDVDFD